MSEAAAAASVENSPRLKSGDAVAGTATAEAQHIYPHTHKCTYASSETRRKRREEDAERRKRRGREEREREEAKNIIALPLPHYTRRGEFSVSSSGEREREIFDSPREDRFRLF